MNKNIKIATIVALTALTSVGLIAGTEQGTPDAQKNKTDVTTAIEASANYESTYLFRGVVQSNDVINYGLKISAGDAIALNVTAVSGIKSENNKGINEIDVGLFGSKTIVGDLQAVYAGNLYAMQQVDGKSGFTNRAYEVGAGLRYKTLFNPTVIVYWNWSYEQVFAEFNLNDEFKVYGNWYVRPSVNVGLSHATDSLPEFKSFVRDSYYYGTGAADVVYKVGKFVEISAGGRYNYLDNSTTTDKWAYGAKVSFSF